MRALGIGDPLACAVIQRLDLARAEHALQLRARQSGDAGAQIGLWMVAQRRAVPVGDGQEFGDIAPGVGAAPDRQEIDELDEELGAAAALAPHRLDDAGEAGQEAVVADAQQRAARHVADARRLDHDRARLAACEAAVPFDDRVGGDAVLLRPPRHHGRNPGPAFEGKRPHPNGREQPRPGSVLARRHGAALGREANALRRLPHIVNPSASVRRLLEIAARATISSTSRGCATRSAGTAKAFSEHPLSTELPGRAGRSRC